ncbi:hypothetical protein MSPP1_003868 [Malassezia sp. CBS 17886]|nr:hypothetical protein MSPP1_003868 [Malassezia sp. CBS 17886]
MLMEPERGDGARRRVARGEGDYDDMMVPEPHWQQRFHQPGRPIGFLAARKTPYRRKLVGRKQMLCCIFITPVVAVVSLVIILLPVLYAVATHTLHTSVMHIYASNITNPGNDSFPLSLEGQVKKAGVFPAHLYFRAPVQVKWNKPPTDTAAMREVVLGHFDLDYIGIAAGHGRIKQRTTFQINDRADFSLFTQYLITHEEFTWRLFCDNVHVEALSFLPTYSNLKLTKDVVFKGINNFEDVRILDFQLPSADPAGGITFFAKASLTNPSPFGFELGRLDVLLSSDGLTLGPGSSPNVNITPGVNIVTLQGRLLPHFDNQAEVDKLGAIMTRYINGDVTMTEAKGVDVVASNGRTPTWLADGIKVLSIPVPLQSPERIDPIKSITIKQFNLTYDDTTSPYAPLAASNSLSGVLALPFGFPLSIISTQNEISIMDETGSTVIANVNGVFSDAATELSVVSDGQTAGTLHLTLRETPLTLPNQTDAARTEFDLFQKKFAFAGPDALVMRGASRALSDTPVGRILLDGIRFNVGTGLLGLQGLSAYPTTINSVDVVGGDSDGLQLAVNTTMVSPSNVNLAVGDTRLLLVNEDVVGDVVLPGLNLVVGANELAARSTFSPKASPRGYETLNRFVSGLDTPLNISGFDGSTAITSLVPAFSAVRVQTTLPGLKDPLVRGASLAVLNTTGIADDVAHSQVTLANPFTGGLTITQIQSNVTSHGIFVASIDAPMHFDAPGKAVTPSPQIPLHLNLYPPDIFGLLRALAVQSGQSAQQLDGLVRLGGYTYTRATSADGGGGAGESGRRARRADEGVVWDADEGRGRRADEGTAPGDDGAAPRPHVARRDANLFTGFDLPSYVHRAFKVLRADLSVMSQATIGTYSVPLQFSQHDVPLATDNTLDLLLPVLSTPIVQKIIDGAALAIDEVTIVDPQRTSFRTRLRGSITNAGPFDATITFPEGLQLAWDGRVLGQIAMPPTQLKADEGAQLDLLADFAVADVGALTAFTKFLVTQPSFVWSISGRNLEVAAIGIKVPGLAINKNVILTGMNNLRNAVNVSTYDLPANDPAGGIHLTAQAVIRNPSQVGVQLSRFGTNVFSNSTNIGPTAAQSPFTLAPLSTTQLPLAGRMVHQEGDGLQTLSTVFTSVVHGHTVPVEIRGAFAGPEDVSWLNEGIKALSVKTALPARHFDVLKAVTLKQMSLFFNKKDQWNPMASSSDTEAPFFLPFAFPLDIRHAGGKFIERYPSTDNAVLDVPMSPATTDVEKRVMSLRFAHVPFAVTSDGKPAFSRFIADTTARGNVTFGLHGAADAQARTAAGDVTITQIPFDVNTTLAGLQNLNVRPVVSSNLDVKHGDRDYLEITLTASMVNPSQLTIGAGDVAFGLRFQNRPIGTANIADLVLVPGVNNVSTAVHYQPEGKANTAAGQVMLENYVQGVLSNASIQGSKDATPIVPLQQAFSGIQLQTQIPPLHQLLITETRLVIPKDIDQTSTAQATFQLQNPFSASINLLKVNASAIYQGQFLGAIIENLEKNPISASGHTKITSRTLPLKMDLDPKHLINFIEKAAATTKTDLGPLQGQFDTVRRMNSTATPMTARPDDSPPDWHSGKQFDVFGAVLSLLRGLTVTLDVQSTTKLDAYETALNMRQEPVPTDTDRSALYLIGPVGKPIVQNIVDGAKLQFSMSNITNVRDDGFDLALQGALLDVGPFDAQIEFPHGVAVNWQGHDIATIQLPPLHAVANEGIPRLVTHGSLKITDQKQFTAFSKYLLHNEAFTWHIHSAQLRVRALGIVFDRVQIGKDLHFQGFNDLPGVRITAFDVPGQTDSALKIKAGTVIPSPATLGIELGRAEFSVLYKGQYQGPIASDNLFLAGGASTASQLAGTITRKSGRKAVNATGELFSNYLQNRNQTLTIAGAQVVTHANGGQPVRWLSDAFKTLQLRVVLPGHAYRVLHSLTIQDLTVTLQKQSQTWAPPTSTNQSIAVFANPLHFSLKPLSSALTATLSLAGKPAGALQVPMKDVVAGTSTGPNDMQTLAVNWRDIPLRAVDHAQFQAMLANLAVSKRTTLGVRGAADLVARMVIGDIPINGVPFDLSTSLAGLDSLTRTAKVHSLDPSAGNPEYLKSDVDMTLTNPSNVTIKTHGLSLQSWSKTTYMGQILVDDVLLIPGKNRVMGEAHISPFNKNDTVAQRFIQEVVQPELGHGKEMIPMKPKIAIHSDPSVHNKPASPFESFAPAAGSLELDAVVPGIASRVISRVDCVFELTTLFAAPGLRPYIWAQLVFNNDLMVQMDIEFIQNESRMAGTGPDGDVYASFTTDMKDCTIAPADHTKVNPKQTLCPRIYNVLGNQGLVDSLPIIGKNVDISNMVTARLGGKNGYVVPALHYNEDDLDATFALSLNNNVILNITDTNKLIDGIKENAGKLSPAQKTNLAQALNQLGSGEIAKIAEAGLGQLVCATQGILSLDLLQAARCALSGGSGGGGGGSRPSASSRSTPSFSLPFLP